MTDCSFRREEDVQGNLLSGSVRLTPVLACVLQECLLCLVSLTEVERPREKQTELSSGILGCLGHRASKPPAEARISIFLLLLFLFFLPTFLS